MASSTDEKTKKPDLDAEYTGHSIQLKDNVLVLYRDLYQISNISSLSIRDQSWKRPPPQVPWACFLAGIVAAGIGIMCPELFQKGGARVLTTVMGVISTLVSGLMLLAHYADNYVSQHSLVGIMNAGNRFMIIHRNESSLRNLLNALGYFMAHKPKQDLTINIDNSTVTNNKNGNVIALGDVGGDISNFYNHE